MGTKYMCALLLLVSALLLHSFSEIVLGSGDGYGYGPAKCAPKCQPPPPPPPPPSSCQPTRLQRAGKALLKFTRSVDDPNGYTSNWKGADTCKFKGVRCAAYPNSNEQAVAGIDLNGAGLSGKKGTPLIFSGILDRIPELTFFHVNSNNFTGAVPTDITKYNYFYELDLSNNKAEGEFPKEVLESKQLVFLDLRFNRLSGSIPPQLFQLDLDVIFINNNQFSGNLPDNFGSTPARFLTFANNQLTGPIPSSIGQASKTLTEVLFLGNQFDGCLPYQIGYLKKATVFDVSKNCLTGPIPHSFACLESIQYLNLEHNQFYGEVPEMVCQLPGLCNKGNFSLSDNYFTQVGPACRDLIMKNVLDVSNNCILGLPNQRPHGQCSEFFSNVKPCPNPKYLHYVPCKGYYPHIHTAAVPAPPLTYNSLNPHRYSTSRPSRH
ncbi:small subunit ribosomal protein S3Ae [Spatholobus suberectus]|nr:small subunit ribosomal protein S3Ae [Spatholobus suberectus]